MLYLAQVQRRASKPKLVLAARRRLDNLWMPIAPPQIWIDLPSKYERLTEELLVVADIKEDRTVVSISLALPEILRSLEQANAKIAHFEKLEASLNEQAQEFFLRRERYDEWEKLMPLELAASWREFCDRYPIPKL